ncbi:hypothetical protein TNCV_3812691 [Trichonephila clavipes]|nr:hypothetical protein TNCV_3812691 [Trichonephila clavipes]
MDDYKNQEEFFLAFYLTPRITLGVYEPRIQPLRCAAIGYGDNSVPIPSCISKYCEVFHFSLTEIDGRAPQELDSALDRELKNSECNSRCQKETASISRHWIRGESEENIEEKGCVASSLTNIIF